METVAIVTRPISPTETGDIYPDVQYYRDDSIQMRDSHHEGLCEVSTANCLKETTQM